MKFAVILGIMIQSIGMNPAAAIELPSELVSQVFSYLPLNKALECSSANCGFRMDAANYVRESRKIIDITKMSENDLSLFDDDHGLLRKVYGVIVTADQLARPGFMNLLPQNLKSVKVSETCNTPITLRYLQRFINLTTLDLGWTQVNDISALAALTNLTTLDLEWTQVTDVSALAALTNLTSLDLGWTQVSNISALAALTNLTSLDLGSTQVSDISALAALTNLTTLDFSDTQVNNISPLHFLMSLTRLSFWDTQVGDAQIEAFRHRVPNCNVWHEGVRSQFNVLYL